jgi:NAD(P)-dependent dehydrogenase (short-subunit alcohol dehydrogenase family)
MTLAHKRLVVTGGARGIGAAAVEACVREGAAVAILDVRDELGRELAERMPEVGPGAAFYVHCDVSDRTEVHAAFATAAEKLSGIDGLVNAAGVERGAPAEQIDDREWDLIMDVNLRGTFLTNQEVFPYLRDAGGRILNFASCAGLIPYVGAAHYAASKGGVIAWTRTVAHEWGKHGISANAICTVVRTPMFEEAGERLDAVEPGAHQALIASMVPLGGAPGDADKDLAPVLVFLLGEGARFITAQVISVDGGLMPTR